MNQYKEDSLDQLTDLLAYRALEMGCVAFSYKSEVFTSYLALQPAGPLLWSLALHANALAAMTNLARPNEVGVLPFQCASNPDAPFKCEVVLQRSTLPFAMAMNFIDSALEHAIGLGIKSLGYKPSEWNSDVQAESRVIPLEPYLADLQQNWANEDMESGDIRKQLLCWPVLTDLEALERSQTLGTSTSDSGIKQSSMMGAR
jgi:hypothetical protein